MTYPEHPVKIELRTLKDVTSQRETVILLKDRVVCLSMPERHLSRKTWALPYARMTASPPPAITSVNRLKRGVMATLSSRRKSRAILAYLWGADGKRLR